MDGPSGRNRALSGVNRLKNQDLIVILCTCPDIQTATDLARSLAEARLAACVNVLAGLHSFYIWNDELQSDEEALMVIKTTRETLPALRDAILSRHPYDVPELIALPVVDGHDAYLRWLAAAVGQATPPPKPK